MGNSLVHVNGKVFEVLGALGEGGFAHVYEVRRDGEHLALKWTRGVTEGEDLERILLELQVLRRLQHRNVLRLVEAEVRKCQDGDATSNLGRAKGRRGGVTTQKEVLMLFPLATRGSLQTHLDRAASNRTAAFAESECLHFVAMLVDAVAALHELGFAHRDLKPANVLLSSSDPVEPLVMDFGSVAPLEVKVRGPMDSRRIWEDAAKYSSAPYRAPELWEHDSDVSTNGVIDGRADVWSLGCILFAMAFGPLSPFEHPRDGVQQLAIINGYVPFPPGNMHFGQMFSATFTALVRWILTPDVAERPTLKGVGLCIKNLLNPAPQRQPVNTNVAVRRSSSRRRQCSTAKQPSFKQSAVVNEEDWADFSAFEQPQLEPSFSMAVRTLSSSRVTKPPLDKRISSARKYSVRHASLTSLGTNISSRAPASGKDRGRRVSDSNRRRTLSQTGKQVWIKALDA